MFEATYLAPALTNPIPSADLIAYHATQLQKPPDDLAEAKRCLLKVRWEFVHHFEEEHKNLIKDLNFGNGKLVLVRDSQCDGDIGSKTKPRYFRPMVVVQQLKGGFYVLAEMDGSLSKLRFVAFQLVPYHAHDRQSIPLTRLINRNIEELINKTHESDEFPEQLHNNSCMIN